MKKYVYILAGLILLFLILIRFLDYAQETKVYRPKMGQSDAIVVITGGKGRAEEGLKMLREGRGRVLILSGVNRDAGIDSIFYNNRPNKEERSNILLDKKSMSTYENAVQVRKIMEKRGLRSMILITSEYHMKRADYIFRNVMPADMKIESYSVKTPNFDEKRWWSPGSLILIVLEFLKFQFFNLKSFLGLLK